MKQSDKYYFTKDYLRGLFIYSKVYFLKWMAQVKLLLSVSFSMEWTVISIMLSQ